MITERKIWPFTPDGDVFRKVRNATSSWVTMLHGQPGFFAPHFPNPWLSFAGRTERDQLLRQLAVAGDACRSSSTSRSSTTRPSASRSARSTSSPETSLYFDNAREVIEPEHVMASGALPPALPMVKIGTDHYWDGGIVSNTPLQHLLDQDDRINTLVFQVDLFSARGDLPRDIQDVMGRHKDIMYSSRTRYNTDVYRRI